MKSEVYDLECLVNCFTYTGYCRQTKELHKFVIHSSRNDFKDFMEHLFREKLIMIGYNNDNYDYPLLHHMINHREDYLYLTGLELAQKIYEKSQKIIDQEFSTVADWNKHLIQIDLFKIWHYDNKAKLTSLKALEVAMNLENVQDMPIHHSTWVREEDIQTVLDYNENDVMATNEFLDITLGKTDHPLYKGKNKIHLRMAVKEKYGLNGLNFNDIKLGTELILKMYCDKFNYPMREVRRSGSPRAIIDLKDCLPKWMNIRTPQFQTLIDKFKKTTIYNGVTKGVLKHHVIYQGAKFDYGTGGMHQCIKPGVYESDDEYMILDLDLDGMYPTLAISQGIYPEHLGPGFIEIYGNELVFVRIAEKKKPKKDRDFVIVEGFKLGANGFYGKTNEENSWAYDPLYTMKTTVSGQIALSMWVERLVEASDCIVLQSNTDGVTIKIHRSKYDACIKVSDDLMEEINMSYESAVYKKMVMRDVNNYSAEYDFGAIKHKGAFEIDKDLHKDPSMRIVAIALEKYFFDDIPVKETIENHDNIYDFCLRLKVDGRFETEYHYIENENVFKSDVEDSEMERILDANMWKEISEGMWVKQEWIDEGLSCEELSIPLREAYLSVIATYNSPTKSMKVMPKTLRYLVTKQGGSLYKRTVASGKKTGVNIGYVVTEFNKFFKVPMKDYNLNYQFYITECNKIIDIVENKQLTLF